MSTAPCGALPHPAGASAEREPNGRWCFRELLSVQPELAKKFNPGVPQRFSINDRLDAERFFLSRPHRRVDETITNNDL